MKSDGRDNTLNLVQIDTKKRARQGESIMYQYRKTTMEYTNCYMLHRHVIFNNVCWDYNKLATMYMYQTARREENRNSLYKS